MVKNFNRWTIVEELPKRNGKRFVSCRCSCGTIAERLLHDIKSGHSKSCGCLRDSLASERATSHGDSKTRLYQCWCKMWRRSHERGLTCNVFPEWSCFLKFKTWSLENGYTDTLQLCRNGDKGNYEPNNVRWDTLENNVIEAKSKTYTFRCPKGDSLTITNLSKYCRENNLSVTGFHRLIGGQKSYKGYTLIN